MAVDNFIPQLWAAELLDNLNDDHVYGALLNRDYEGDISAFGDSVRINSIGRVEQPGPQIGVDQPPMQGDDFGQGVLVASPQSTQQHGVLAGFIRHRRLPRGLGLGL